LFDIKNLNLNSLCFRYFWAANRQAVRVRQEQPHRRDVAGIAQLAEFLGKSFPIDRLSQNPRQLVAGPRATPGIAATTCLPRCLRFGHFSLRTSFSK
jgi:hypothetical protein